MLETRGLCRLQVGPVDLTLQTGECISVAGRSGSGKSVLLRMIADLDPHEGEAWLDARCCSTMSAPAWRRMVTYVAAESGWWDDQVATHFPPEFDLRSLLPVVGIASDAADWPVARLSTGERQRIALLRALTAANRVLLLDEPTSALDAQSTGLVETLLRSRQQAGTSILLVTHDPGQAARMATRHLELRDGLLQERGS